MSGPSAVPAGFKLTDAGIIPADWNVRCVSAALLSGPKNGYSGRSGKDAGGTPTLMLSATTSGRMILNDQTVKGLFETLDARSDGFLDPGDVLVQRSNTIELVGTTAIYDGPSGFYAYPDLMMRLRFKAPETAHWFWRYANSSAGRQYFVSVAAGSTGSMPKLSGDTLRNMPLPMPEPAEQQAIAGALSDADAWIASLEGLVAKKRDLKQAAMQQLLTGKQRLPGFAGEWEVKRLGEIGQFLKGSGVKKDDARSGALPCIRYGEIYTRHHDYIRRFYSWISPEVAATASTLKKGDLLFTGSGETREEIGKCVAFVQDCEAYAGGDIVILRPRSGDPVYMGYYLNTRPIRSQKASKGQGDTVVHIGSAALAQLECVLPGVPEQTAIGKVLTDMDTQIEALEAKLTKARQIKQGMMQELLTGRTRLVGGADAGAG